jgi:hypothetical protein
MVLKAGNFKEKLPADSVSEEGSLPGLLMATFLLCPHMGKGGEGGQMESFFPPLLL